MKTFANQSVFLILSLAILIMACTSNGDEERARLTSLTEAVYASGYVLPLDDHKLYSQAEGVLIKVYAREGDMVKKGEPLFEIAGVQQDILFRKAQDQYQIAQENYNDESPVLQEIAANLENAQSVLQNDSLNFARHQALYDKKAISGYEYERARLSYETAKNHYYATKNTYQHTKKQLWLALREAENQLSISADEKNRYIISSPADARIYELYRQPGELIRRNEAVAMIGQSDQVYLQLQIDEMDIKRVELNQPIKVKIDVYNDKFYNARVSKIYPMLNIANQSFRVDARFTEEIPGGFAGLNVEANIIIAEKEQTLTIPRRYLQDDHSVLIKEGKNTVKKEVKTGMVSFDKVEILSGIDTTHVLVEL
ncbi:MAG: efflux RND transporter periplasmic adaptor subunit [Cyclobacteriaceae bacterium]|nr:efflux RND transporter periplasmic adaptor subunit [Cyclobacteriaceae bacterium]